MDGHLDPLLPASLDIDEGDPPAAGDPAGEVEIERAEILPRSILWKLQRAYFERVGIDAWRAGQVPHYVTSNPFVAAAYAQIVVGLLRDRAAAGDGSAEDPLIIVELGAGSGRFTYHLLKKLMSMPRIPVLERVPFRYVMTDVSPMNLAFWRDHPQLRPFFEAGVLDVALFDATRDEALTLQISGETIAPGASARPILAIANYVFDGLPMHAFRIENGRIHEARVTVTAPDPSVDPADPAALERLGVAWEYACPEGDPDIDPDHRFLLDEYRISLGEGAVQIPTAALGCIERLSRIAGGSLVLISADKGYCHEEDLLYRPDPEIVRHGSVSVMVNYHAIGRYVDRLGGQALFPAHRASSLCVGAFLLGAPAGGVETASAFAEAVMGFGPDEWFAAKKGLDMACKEMSLASLLAAIQLSGPDGKVVMDVFDRLMDLAPDASAGERRASFGIARRAWDLHYHLGEARDLAFHLGAWMRELGYVAEAIAFFERSLDLYGKKPETAYNLAYCHLAQQRCAEALRWIEEAIAAAPDLPGARALRIEIRAVIRDESRTAGPGRAVA